MTSAQPSVAAGTVVARLRRVYRAQWAIATLATVSVGWAALSDHLGFAVVLLTATVTTVLLLARRVQATYRRVLDPCRGIGVADIDDITVLLGYYQSAADGPLAVRRAWLPPVTFRRMVARRASTPWWGPLGNLAYASCVSSANSTRIMPFLVEALKTARDTWGCPDGTDTGAISAVRLREVWAEDIVRQQCRDAHTRSQADAAWVLLEL